MPGLLKEVEEQFGKKDLYDVLNIHKAASKAEVKKAYYKISMTVHPDKVAQEEIKIATKQFQVLAKIYSILSDDEKRAVYDETGSVDDDDVLDQDKDWYEYWRLLFPKIDLKDIDEFEEQYKGSTEEKEDLKSAYLQHEGDMDRILDTIMCCTLDDEPRFREILTELIDNGELERFDKFENENPSKTKSRRRKANAEKLEAEEELKKIKKGKEEDSLKAMIARNQKSREKQGDDFLAQLEKKYGGGKPSKKGKGK